MASSSQCGIGSQQHKLNGKIIPLTNPKTTGRYDFLAIDTVINDRSFDWPFDWPFDRPFDRKTAVRGCILQTRQTGTCLQDNPTSLSVTQMNGLSRRA
ncbi:MAG: hypothetical protein EBU63_04575 [Alphaproteobacteria bacterium]|nr:hypothetical protein [Alphaproteobacteria bacterium]